MKQSVFTNDNNFFKSNAMTSSGLLIKGIGGFKYFKREGGPGNYKYYYTEAAYNKAKGKQVVKKEEPKKEEKKKLTAKEKRVEKTKEQIEDKLKEEKLDFEKTESGYKVKTPVGDWNIVGVDDDAIYTKFENPAKAHNDLHEEVNRFSGKWNIHGKDPMFLMRRRIEIIADSKEEVKEKKKSDSKKNKSGSTVPGLIYEVSKAGSSNYITVKKDNAIILRLTNAPIKGIKKAYSVLNSVLSGIDWNVDDKKIKNDKKYFDLTVKATRELRDKGIYGN